MSELKLNIIPPVKNSPVSAVREQLERILDNLKKNRIPNNEEIEYLEELMTLYRKEFASKEKKIEFLSKNKETGIELAINFQDTLPGFVGEFSVEEAVLSDRHTIWLLKKLALRKLIPEDLLADYSDTIEFLLKKGIANYISIEGESVDATYLCMTTNGWHWIKSQKASELIRTQDPSFILSEKLCLPPNEWRKTTFLRAAIIQKYYEQRGIEDYYIFADYDYPQMIFGCEVNDSYSVNYSFAGAFDNDTEQQEMARLYKIGNSSKIETLTVIVQKENIKKKLALRLGLDTRNIAKLRYYSLAKDVN